MATCLGLKSISAALGRTSFCQVAPLSCRLIASSTNQRTASGVRPMVGATLNEKKKKYTKSNLPVKICVVCNKPMNWRKKWEKVWDEVKYCSERCRRSAKGKGGVPSPDGDGNSSE